MLPKLNKRIFFQFKSLEGFGGLLCNQHWIVTGKMSVNVKNVHTFTVFFLVNSKVFFFKIENASQANCRGLCDGWTVHSSLWRRANARNVSFGDHSVVKTKISCNNPTDKATVFFKTYPSPLYFRDRFVELQRKRIALLWIVTWKCCGPLDQYNMWAYNIATRCYFKGSYRDNGWRYFSSFSSTTSVLDEAKCNMATLLHLRRFPTASNCFTCRWRHFYGLVNRRTSAARQNPLS